MGLRRMRHRRCDHARDALLGHQTELTSPEIEFRHTRNIQRWVKSEEPRVEVAATLLVLHVENELHFHGSKMVHGIPS